MNNHAHLLVKSGPAGLAGFMRRLLTGHAAVLGKSQTPWQTIEEVLRWFGRTEKRARAAYRRFAARGEDKGHRPEVVGAGESGI